jgi:SulP family sulfate permease
MNKQSFISASLPFLSWWPLVNSRTIKADFSAGLTNAIIVLPQGVAFAMIAGLPPIYGLYTAMVVPIVAALFGSSLHLISGPNTAVSLVFFAVLSQLSAPGTEEFIQLAFVLTLISGVIQLIMGIARMGVLVNFVSNAVIVGFTTGAAVLIATSQAKHIFGVMIPKGTTFYHVWEYLFMHLADINYLALGIASFTLLTAVLLKRAAKKWSWLPNLLLAMIFGSVATYILDKDTHSLALVGALPHSLPSFNFPDITLAHVVELTPSAFAVALLGLIQAVAIARSIAIKSHQQLDASQEFIGEGLSNIVGSMFMCYASSGSFTRSGINYDAGAKTPMSSIFAAIFLALILLLIAPLTAYLPIATMGGIILLVAYNLIDWRMIRRMIKVSKRETLVMSITFFSTLFLDLEFAIYLGVIFSLALFLQQTVKPRIVVVAPDKTDLKRSFVNIERKPLKTCPQLQIIRIDGPLYFGAVSAVSEYLVKLKKNDAKNLLIIGAGVSLIDMAGAELLESQAEQWRHGGGKIYFCSLRLQVRDFLRRGGYHNTIGKDVFFETKKEAIRAIYNELDKEVCAGCEQRIFLECK